MDKVIKVGAAGLELILGVFVVGFFLIGWLHNEGGVVQASSDSHSTEISNPYLATVTAMPGQSDTLAPEFTLASLNLLSANGTPLPYNLCLQTDTGGSFLQINTTTGQYLFTNCENGSTISGQGEIRTKGCSISLVDSLQVRVQATIDTCLSRGSASIQALGASTITILDRNIRNNPCACSSTKPVSGT